MSFRFRLTFHHRFPGFFRFEEESFSFLVGNGIELNLTARDADKLSEATQFHIEGKGFNDETAARDAGNHLRLRLRLVNSMFNLGLNVPTVDGTTAKMSSSLKEKMFEDTRSVLIDSITGLGVFPDGDEYFEFIASGKIDVHPSDPSYIFKSLGDLWGIDITLDEQAEDALEIMGRAITESSMRARFLLMYLALERLVERIPRSEASRNVISYLQCYVRKSGLDGKEADSLVGALANLKEQSFKSALMALADRINGLDEIGGQPVRKFLSDCVSARNAIAHNASIDPGFDLQKLSEGLQNFILCLIWSRNNIPSFSGYRPADALTFKGMSIRVR